MKRELQLILFAFFPSRYRDPWLMVFRAFEHVTGEYVTRASFQDRGWFLPNQTQTLDILTAARKQIGANTPLLRAEPSAEAGKLR